MPWSPRANDWNACAWRTTYPAAPSTRVPPPPVPRRNRSTPPSKPRAALSAGRNYAVGGRTCYVGPRGGTYTITASGRKNYNGC